MTILHTYTYVQIDSSGHSPGRVGLHREYPHRMSVTAFRDLCFVTRLEAIDRPGIVVSPSESYHVDDPTSMIFRL